MNNDVLFIVFEGPDGSGKSTISKKFCEYLEQQNIKYILTREPGGNNIKLSEELRSILLDQNNINISYEAEAYLFASSRSQHVSELILPSIKNNITVVCDRFVASSLAYQGYARNIGIENVYKINELILDKIKPNITFYIDINYQTGLDRIAMNNRNQNRLDREVSIHKNVEIGYKKVIDSYKDKFNFIILDGNKSIDELVNDVIKEYNKFIERR